MQRQDLRLPDRLLRLHSPRQRRHPRLRRRNLRQDLSKQRQDLRLPDRLLRFHSPRQLRLDMRHPDRLLKQRRPDDLMVLLPAQLAPVSGLRGLLQEVDIVADLLQEVGIVADLLPDAMEVVRIGVAMTGVGAAEATAPGVVAPETCPGGIAA